MPSYFGLSNLAGESYAFLLGVRLSEDWVLPWAAEPPEKVKLVTATPVANKKQLARKRGKLNCGKLKPVRGGHEPMGLDRLHGVVGLPEVAEYGDIVEVVTS